MRRRGFWVIAAGVGLLSLPAASSAATIEVTTDADEFGQGGSSACTLREAVEAARTNNAFGGCSRGSKTKPDRVVLTGDVTLTRTGNTATNADGDLDYDKGGPLIIDGGDEALSAKDINVAGGWSDRILETGHEKVTLRTVNLSDGNTVGDADSSGGAVRAYTGAQLTLQDVMIQDSAAGNRGGAIACEGCKSLALKRSFVLAGNSVSGISAKGGAIWSNGPVKLVGNPAPVFLPGTQAQILNNEVNSTGDADIDGGGGIYATDDLTIRRVDIEGNDAGHGRGGGISFSSTSGELSVADSTIADNNVAGGGGGIAAFGDDATVAVKRTAVIENSVTGDSDSPSAGGGAFIGAPRATINETVFDSNAVNGNPSQNSFGGGLALSALDGFATVSKTSVTNNAVGIGFSKIGGGISAVGPVHIVNSTISGNLAFGSNGEGGGFRTYGLAMIDFSTIESNSAGSSGSALATAATGDIRLRGSIVKQTGDACEPGHISSKGFNVDNTGDADCALTAPTDSAGTALLGSRQENGSPPVGYLEEAIPLTVASVSDSSQARDFVPKAKCKVDGKPLRADARGVPRPVGEKCDAGGIERTSCLGFIVSGPGSRVGRNSADVIQGTTGQNAVLAQGGNDHVNIYAGADRLCAGPGNDTMRVGENAPSIDKIDGGPGRDFVDYNDGGTLTLDLAAGTGDGVISGQDTLKSIEGAKGSEGPDTLLGDNGANLLIGGGDPDTIKGRGGVDKIDAKDGEVDVVINCGPGNNTKEKAKIDRGLDPKPKSC